MNIQRITFASATLATLATGAMADQQTDPAPDLLTSILTDAIRIEVEPSKADSCAPTVAWAFNLPLNSLIYDPQCAVITPNTTLTQNLKN